MEDHSTHHHRTHHHRTDQHRTDQHGGHTHAPLRESIGSRFGSGALLAGLCLTLVFAVIELFSGWLFGSLALMSDSGHMFSDATALAIAVVASRIALRPPGSKHTYGFARAEIVAAFVNGLLLLAIVVVIFVEAIRRLQNPQPVSGAGVMFVAALGLLVNFGVLYLLGHGERNLNTRAATLHVLGDLIGSVAALTAGAVIYVTGWMPIDPLLSIVISVLILVSTVRILREALHVLMEGVPVDIDLADVGNALAELEGVHSVHDLHIWTIASGQIALSAHVDVDELESWPAMLEKMRSLVWSRFRIDHVTVQPETVGGINAGQEAVIRIVPDGDRTK
jgi:cobalt-zinc-cadmium efflux system protein